MNICSYGCGGEGTYYFKTVDKWCHYEKGHRDECSTGNLAQKQCYQYGG